MSIIAAIIKANEEGRKVVWPSDGDVHTVPLTNSPWNFVPGAKEQLKQGGWNTTETGQ